MNAAHADMIAYFSTICRFANCGILTAPAEARVLQTHHQLIQKIVYLARALQMTENLLELMIVK